MQAHLPVTLFQAVGHGHYGRSAYPRLSNNNSCSSRFMNVNHFVWLTAKERFPGVAANIQGKSIAPEPFAARRGHIFISKELCFPSKGFQLGMNGFHHARHAAPKTPHHIVRNKHAL